MFGQKADSAVFADHPLLARYAVQKDILAKEKEVLIARSLPDITLGYVNQTLVGIHTIDGEEVQFGPSDRFHAGQIGLQVPLFYGATKKRSNVLGIEQEQNELQAQYMRQNLSLSFEQVYTKYTGLMDSYKIYEEQLIPQIKVMNDQALLMLETGEISMIEFLQAKQSVNAIEMNFLDLKKEINTTVNELNWYVQNEKE
jgi:cobalt-zinc-cadmium resistance protein CzcA